MTETNIETTKTRTAQKLDIDKTHSNSDANTTELNTSEANTTELNDSELNISEANTTELNDSELNTSEANTTELNYSELNTGETNIKQNLEPNLTGSSKSNNNHSFAIVGILTILLLGFVLYSMSSNPLIMSKHSITGNLVENPNIADLTGESKLSSADLENSPKITLNTELKKLGTINQNDGIIKTNFEIQNTGKSTLVIDYLETSCMCTSVSLNKNGIEGPRFGMIMEGNEIPEDYKLELEPGETVKLNVFYDPLAHGIQDKSELLITRIIAIHSNDPITPTKQIKFLLKQKK